MKWDRVWIVVTMDYITILATTNEDDALACVQEEANSRGSAHITEWRDGEQMPSRLVLKHPGAID